MKPILKTWDGSQTLLLACLIGLGGWTQFAALRDIWMVGTGSEEQSHILLAPFVAIWLFWLRRSRLRAVRLAPTLWGPVIIAAGWIMSRFGYEMGVQVAWHLGALVTLVGCVVTLTGFSILRHFAPAFVALLFLIPVPGTIRQLIAIPLQAVATNITQIMLEVIGIPATRDGHVLLINGEQVAVDEACNGMRMVFALTLIVYAFAFSTPLRPSVRVLLLVLSPIAALVSNIIRLIPTTVFFGYGSVEQAQHFHDIAGWIMLPVALLMLFGVLRMIRWIELPVMPFRLTMR
jgi:exosortase